MTWSGLATLVVVPPANLAVLAALALATRRRRLAGLALALLLGLGLPPVAERLLRSLEDPAWNVAALSDVQVSQARAIVVLGAEIVLLADGRTVPGPLTLGRLRTAASLARRTGLPLLVSGGVTQAGAAPVARAMQDSLRDDFAVPPRWVEDRSADTFANARDSAALLAASGVTKVLLVTDAWHLRRALLAFRAAGLPAIAAPVPGPASRTIAGGFDMTDLAPQARAWQRSFYALHEWIGLGWYTLRAAL